MFWFGLLLTIVFSAGFVLKMCVIWSVSRCPHGGGGAPTMDFILFYPVFLAIGVTVMLASMNALPFPYFGFALYGAVLGLTIFIHWLFDHLGTRFLAAQERAVPNDSDQ